MSKLSNEPVRTSISRGYPADTSSGKIRRSLSMPPQARETGGLYKTATLRMRTSRKIVEGNNAAPFRLGNMSRLLRSFRPNADVKVEQSPSGVSAAVLYASEDGDDMLAPTTIISGVPSLEYDDLVFQDSAFEVRVVGMHVPDFDTRGPASDNELFMYSQDTTDMSEPTIHYDYSEDDYAGISGSNVYVPIPACKSYVTGSDEKHLDNASSRKTVNVRFCILELDKPGQMTKDAINGISDVGRMVRQEPASGNTTSAVKIASALSKRALHAYAKPDKVFMCDCDFTLADRDKIAKRPRAGEYLKHGYYFFLSEPIEGQLYASVRTPKNVRLMFKRAKGDGRSGRRWPFGRQVDAKEYFPLTNVSYVVVRVSEPVVGNRKSASDHPETTSNSFKLPALYPTHHQAKMPAAS